MKAFRHYGEAKRHADAIVVWRKVPKSRHSRPHKPAMLWPHSNAPSGASRRVIISRATLTLADGYVAVDGNGTAVDQIGAIDVDFGYQLKLVLTINAAGELEPPIELQHCSSGTVWVVRYGPEKIVRKVTDGWLSQHGKAGSR